MTSPDPSPATANVLWLASYPKSGNTWLRALLYHLLHGRLECSEDLQRAILDAHKLRQLPVAKNGSARLIKTHWLPGAIPFRHRMAGFVYVVRNPWNVALSNFDYRLLCGPSETDLETDRAHYVEQFVEQRGDPRWRRLAMGSWSEHVRAWRELGTRVPHLWLRYEDLAEDPERETARLCRFLGLKHDGEAIAQAIAGASFAAMRRLEEAEIRDRRNGLFGQESFQAGHQMGRRFINRGRTTWGREQLTPEQIRRIGEAFAAELELLGYPKYPQTDAGTTVAA